MCLYSDFYLCLLLLLLLLCIHLFISNGRQWTWSTVAFRWNNDPHESQISQWNAEIGNVNMRGVCVRVWASACEKQRSRLLTENELQNMRAVVVVVVCCVQARYGRKKERKKERKNEWMNEMKKERYESKIISVDRWWQCGPLWRCGPLIIKFGPLLIHHQNWKNSSPNLFGKYHPISMNPSPKPGKNSTYSL